MTLFLKGTITSTKDLEADGLYLVVSLSGNRSNKKQRTTVSTKGITWSGRTFELLAGDLGTRLEFKIEASTFPLKKTVVGEVDVLVNGSVSAGLGSVCEWLRRRHEAEGAEPQSQVVVPEDQGEDHGRSRIFLPVRPAVPRRGATHGPPSDGI